MVALTCGTWPSTAAILSAVQGNRLFSRNLVNRVWGELLGRGFVNPVDDFRADNPPSHPKALDYLADEFVANGYDVRWLVRTIIASKASRMVSHAPSRSRSSLSKTMPNWNV